MGAVAGADDDELRDAIGIALRESERHHAAVGAAGDRAQWLDAQVIEQRRSASA